MPKRTVKDKAFRYFEEGDHPVEPGKKVLRQRLARRGDTLDFREEDAARGDHLGAFYTDAELNAMNSDSAGEPDMTPATMSGKSVEELTAWLEEERPNAPKTVAAAGDDPELAARLLEAEESVTGREARSSVVSKLQEIIDSAEEEDDEEDDEEEDEE